MNEIAKPQQAKADLSQFPEIGEWVLKVLTRHYREQGKVQA